jgi:feruloyl esterase
MATTKNRQPGGVTPAASDRPDSLKGLSRAAFLIVAMTLTGRLIAATTCDVKSMQAAAPADTTIISAQHLQAPVPHCKVEGYVTATNPGPNKDNFRLQLPDKALWKHRFYFIGVGGSGGSVPTDSQIPRGNPMVQGFAVAGTDKGHQTAALDWSFQSDPAKALDNAHRAAHLTTVASQQLTRAYYGTTKMYRYETGCSGGGDMGMQAMTHYPPDYDGVLLGWIGGPHPDPKKDGTVRNFAVMVREMTREPGAWISPAKRKFVDQKVLQACDAADGAKDDMIWDSRLCKFDFGTLKCSGADGPECLTQPEITSFNHLISETAAPISNVSSWAYLGNVPPPWDPSPAPENANKTSSAYVILNGWARTLLKQPDRDIIKDPLTEAEIKTIETEQMKQAFVPPSGWSDLTGFENTKGKAIFYASVGDPAFPHVSMENYFRLLTEKMGAQRVANFARLYTVPGWGHCGGGSGPTDGQDRMLQALITWVEQGQTPQSIEMHRGADRAQMMFATAADAMVGVAVPQATGASRDFLICPYPLVSVFDQSKADLPGAIYDAKNWQCRASRG